MNLHLIPEKIYIIIYIIRRNICICKIKIIKLCAILQKNLLKKFGKKDAV